MNSLIQQKVDGFFKAYPPKAYAAQEILIFADENPTVVYYLLKGKVGQYDVTSKGQQLMVNIFKPPAFFPMSDAINQRPNQYLYEVLEPARVHVAPAVDVVAWLRREPVVLFDLLSRVYKGSDGLLRQKALLMGGNALSVIAFQLLVSCLRFGEKDSRGGYTLVLKESELAARTGLARETVSRNLQILKKQRLIQTKPGVVYIPDVRQLQDMPAQDCSPLSQA